MLWGRQAGFGYMQKGVASQRNPRFEDTPRAAFGESLNCLCEPSRSAWSMTIIRSSLVCSPPVLLAFPMFDRSSASVSKAVDPILQ